eukprot:CAMPEP_0177579542 /NCGR_PEP_ID=MMETSP0419_2-20121207/1021_1 /TAXON_ID=582737 /ORGANISM="Tetraselmis sp., Strain GSL018" /LENGTH=580 /DNA_ID=CAMNT_0019068227 /DNA_START=351 /DNA_END=2089 /DNA_ORIENTATION=+
MQAAHDLLFHRGNLTAYDHHEFPGVVPRTFTGAAILAALSYPAAVLVNAAGLPKFAAQYAVRAALGLLSFAALMRLRRAIARAHGPAAGRWWALLCACQFHLPYYASRLLPNSLAAVVSCTALAEWVLARRPAAVVALMAFATVVLRGDMLLLSGAVGVQMLASGRLSLSAGLKWGALAVAVSLASTVPFDSLLWRRWVWPEGEVLWFNTVLNRSSEWGVMPLHWYWTSALPLLGGAALVPVGALLDAKARAPAVVAAAFVGMYSFLPHKELRFLLPALPLFNLVAAAGMAKLELHAFPVSKDGRKRAPLLARLAFWAGTVAVVGSLFPALVLLRASHLNYPGGVALERLHAFSPCTMGTVHIGVQAAMTGVTRFGELGPPWSYSKAEGIPQDSLRDHGFSCLLSGEAKVPGYTVLAEVDGFRRLTAETRLAEAVRRLLSLRLPINWEVAPMIYVHLRSDLAGRGREEHAAGGGAVAPSLEAPGGQGEGGSSRGDPSMAPSDGRVSLRAEPSSGPAPVPNPLSTIQGGGGCSWQTGGARGRDGLERSRPSAPFLERHAWLDASGTRNTSRVNGRLNWKKQ